MKRYRKINIAERIKCFLLEHLPSRNDSLKRIFIKIAFLLCCVGILFSGIYYTVIFAGEYKEKKLIYSQIEQYSTYGEKYAEACKKENSDYTAWLSSKYGFISSPVFKTDNNSFYLSHNSQKKSSRYGSLCMDYRNTVYDKNIVIYGKANDEGPVFGYLNYLRLLDFFKQNSFVTLAVSGEETIYDIYAVFVLNSAKEQDDGRIYDIYRQNSSSKQEFDEWVNDAKERSVITTNVDVTQEDRILTLVTNCDDFEGARLVVMARSRAAGTSFNSQELLASPNPNPKYPKIWYTQKNIAYPFENTNNN